MINYKVTSEPIVEPITLEEAKLFLKIDDFTTEDNLIKTLITAARQSAESYTGRAFITQTVVMAFDDLYEFDLIRSPVQEVTSITYLDSDGTRQTLSTDVYDLDLYAYPNRIVLKHGQTWPVSSSQKGNVLVTYKAGYGDTPAEVPKGIHTAIEVILTDYYHNRNNPVRKFPTLAERLLDVFKIYRFV